MSALISLIVIAVLAVAFGVVVLIRSAGPSNRGPELGSNSPWPSSYNLVGPLTSHADPRWVDAELRREEHQHRHPEREWVDAEAGSEQYPQPDHAEGPHGQLDHDRELRHPPDHDWADPKPPWERHRHHGGGG